MRFVAMAVVNSRGPQGAKALGRAVGLGRDRYALDESHAMNYGAVLTAALNTQAYTDHWGIRCDVFDIPGVDRRAYLRPSSDATLAFHVVPADTLSLARVFYRRTRAVAGVRLLARESGWGVKQAFHFGFMSTGYAWTNGDINIDRYLDLWVAAIETAGAVERADWDRYFAWLVDQRIATPKDRTEFDRHFTETVRQKATPRPGINIVRLWPLREAEDLNRSGQLVPQVRAAYDRIAELLGR
jgi:hypothetical protein